jgi:hypothetical protein
MAEYWGVKAIGKRLRVSPPTVQRLHLTAGLLMYRRTLKGVAKGRRRWVWFTSDELIRVWELARCKADLEWARTQRASRANHLGSDVYVRTISGG